MDESQPSMTNSQKFGNHMKVNEGSNSMSLDQEVLRPKHYGYPSVDGLPKYPQTNQLQYIIKNVIKSMIKHKLAGPFLKPVDKKVYSDYYDIVTKPIDLNYIKKKLNGKHYQSSTDCIADFRQMFANCKTYNQDKDDPDILKMNTELENYFNSKVVKMPMKVGSPASPSQFEQTMISRAKPTKKGPFRSSGEFSLLNGTSFDVDESSNDNESLHTNDDQSNYSMFHNSSIAAKNDDHISIDSEMSRKSVKRKAEVLSSPPKSRPSNVRQVPKKIHKDAASDDRGVDIGEPPTNLPIDLKYCFEILKDFYKTPLSARACRFFQMENLSMDFNTILKKFHENKYEDVSQFAYDMRSVFTDVCRFHAQDDSLIHDALDLKFEFEYKFGRKPEQRTLPVSYFNQQIDEMVKFNLIAWQSRIYDKEYIIPIHQFREFASKLEALKEPDPPRKKMKLSSNVSPQQQQLQQHQPQQQPQQQPLQQQQQQQTLQQQPPQQLPRQQMSRPSALHNRTNNDKTSKKPARPKLKVSSNASPRSEGPSKARTPPSAVPGDEQFDLSYYLQINSNEKRATEREMENLGKMVQNLPAERIPFLMKLLDAAEPVDDPTKEERNLNLESLKPSTFRAVEKYAAHCLGIIDKPLFNDAADDDDAGQYKVPELPAKIQPPTKSPPTTTSLLHNNNTTGGIIPHDLNLSVSSNSSSSSCSSVAPGHDLSPFLLSSPIPNANLTQISQQQQITAEHSKTVNGDGSKKAGTIGGLPPLQNPVRPVPNNLPASPSYVTKYPSTNKLSGKQLPGSESVQKGHVSSNATECKTSQASDESSPNDTNLGTKNSKKQADKTSDDKPPQGKVGASVIAVSRDTTSTVSVNSEAAANEDSRTDAGARPHAWGATLQKSRPPASQKPPVNTDETFFKFKKQAQEKLEREKMTKQQEQERKHRIELENAERLKKEKELKQAQEEEEALHGAMVRPRPPEPQAPLPRSTPPSIIPTVNSQVMSPSDVSVATLSAAERRLIEQERRQKAARARKIDLNLQSEIFAAFERDLQGQPNLPN